MCPTNPAHGPLIFIEVVNDAERHLHCPHFEHVARTPYSQFMFSRAEAGLAQ